jgi:uncharacterized membrane protein YoaT (DUF817 family)
MAAIPSVSSRRNVTKMMVRMNKIQSMIPAFRSLYPYERSIAMRTLKIAYYSLMVLLGFAIIGFLIWLAPALARH